MGQLTCVGVGAADTLHVFERVEYNSLIRTNGAQDITARMDAQTRGRTSMLRQCARLVAALEDLDGSLARSEHDARTAPQCVRDGLADGDLALDLVCFDGVDRCVACQTPERSVGALDGERGCLCDGRGIRCLCVKGGDFVGGDPASGCWSLLATL